MDNWEEKQEMEVPAQEQVAQEEKLQTGQRESVQDSVPVQHHAPEQPQPTPAPAGQTAPMPPYTFPGHVPNWPYAWQAPGYAPYPGYGAAPYAQAVPAKAENTKKPKAKKTRRFFAWVAAIVLAAGLSCGVTALVMHRVYGKEAQQLRQEWEQDLQRYAQQLEALEARLNGQMLPQYPSQAELPEGVLTPAQLYSFCVNSVVAISNQKGSVSGGFSTVGTGSGFIFTEDGYIVSNHHVVDGADRLIVTMHGGTEYEAKLIGSDNINDVAVLKIEGDASFPAAKLGSSNALNIGDQVVAIGNPLGDLTATATVGYISGKDRPVNTEGIIIDMLQTDAAINSGNSGGPLFNMYGQVVGITTAKYSGTTNSGASIEGIGFAIPIDDVWGMIQDFKDHGYITGGYLGVMVSSMDPTVAELYNLPVGAYVSSVTKGSCAEKAGIQKEDIITALGGQTVENLTDLTRALRDYKAGDEVTVTVYRGGATLSLTVVLDPKPRS